MSQGIPVIKWRNLKFYSSEIISLVFNQAWSYDVINVNRFNPTIQNLKEEVHKIKLRVKVLDFSKISAIKTNLNNAVSTGDVSDSFDIGQLYQEEIQHVYLSDFNFVYTRYTYPLATSQSPRDRAIAADVELNFFRVLDY